MLKIQNNHIPVGLYEVVDQNSAALTMFSSHALIRTKYEVAGQTATVTGVMTQ